MTLAQQELDNIIRTTGPLLDENAREVFRHLVRRIEALETEVNRLSEAASRTDKDQLERLLEEHIEYHSRKHNGARTVIDEDKPMVDLLRQLIAALPD